jgi:alkylhydroperoxidase family enzyme
MPWIDAPHEDDWDDSFDELKPEVTDRALHRVDWIMRIHALDAGSMNAHNVLYRQVMKGTATLRKVEREMVALVVSKTNGCHY